MSIEGVLESLHRLESADLRQGAVERERLLAGEADAVAEPAGQQDVEIGGQLGKIEE